MGVSSASKNAQKRDRSLILRRESHRRTCDAELPEELHDALTGHAGSGGVGGSSDAVCPLKLPLACSERQPKSGLMLAARITLPHFSVSAAMWAPNCAGLRSNGRAVA
jgi:hypothetical protein